MPKGNPMELGQQHILILKSLRSLGAFNISTRVTARACFDLIPEWTDIAWITKPINQLAHNGFVDKSKSASNINVFFITKQGLDALHNHENHEFDRKPEGEIQVTTSGDPEPKDIPEQPEIESAMSEFVKQMDLLKIGLPQFFDGWSKFFEGIKLLIEENNLLDDEIQTLAAENQRLKQENSNHKIESFQEKIKLLDSLTEFLGDKKAKTIQDIIKDLESLNGKSVS